MSIVQSQRPQNGTELAGLDGEIVEYQTPAVLGVQIQSEIEAQVAVARKYPRSIKHFMDDAMALATVSKEIAQSCMYAIPRGGKTIEGPSVRLAEIMFSCFGNLRVVARVLGDDTRFITAQATCMDVQKNVGVTIEVKRRITDKNGKTYPEDMIAVTGAAAVAIARRNAIFAVVPNSFRDILYAQCKVVARGNVESFTQERDGWVQYFVPRKVSLERLLRTLGVASVADMSTHHVDTLIGLSNAIKEGETTIDGAFPPLDTSPLVPKPGGTKTERLKEELKGKGGPSPNLAPAPNPDAEDPTPEDGGEGRG